MAKKLDMYEIQITLHIIFICKIEHEKMKRSINQSIHINSFVLLLELYEMSLS